MRKDNGQAYLEIDPGQADRETIVRNFIAGEYDRPLSVTVRALRMDLQFLELVGLTAVAGMSAVAALMHGQVFFGAFLHCRHLR